tara:strand:- start:9162 stop:9998 length:837 start_codon:yes stop_codon:yes gene_type:complete
LNKIKLLEQKAGQLRKDLFEMCVNAGHGHLSSGLSCTDILTSLFYGNHLVHNPSNPNWKDRDRFFLSKGHAAIILYVVLADRGYFPKEDLQNFSQRDGKFSIHLQKDVPGAEISAGSLGHGFGIAVGSALAAKLDRKLHLNYALLGDGETYEGSVWEGAMFAAHHKLNNLVAIIDRNYQCTLDFTENLLRLEPLEDKWRSFGWRVKRINGHCMKELDKAFLDIRRRPDDKPTVIIADTIKGKGIEHLSHKPLSHGRTPKSDKEITMCRSQLEEGLKNE